MESLTISGIYGIIGAIIGGGFTLIGTYYTFKNQREQASENEKKIMQSLLQAIHDELETINERYQETVGSRIESLEEGKGLTFYYPLVSDYFSVYNGNTFLIGRIENNDLRKQIIKTYTLLKGMVDSFRLNNDLVQKFEHSNKIFDETQSDVHRQHAIAHHMSLVEYAKTLQKGHQSLKQEMSILLRSIRKQGVLSEKMD
ncbi:hypothetical protein [Sulfuricurvum sp.]|uniref:hypothetical protein n=1 Tax=Sulfuricurvum sp. TaxID=2025608 RepID=UPI0026164D35|nr:hypothetical protein [Sulfuricurvum sp.]MDD3597178.1 hypothetical protein [Sulfuricurvum sp.]